MSWQDRELAERDDREGRKFAKHGSKKKVFHAEIDSNTSDSDEGDANVAGNESNSEDEVNELEQLSDPDEQEEFANALARKFESRNNYKKHKRTFVQAREYVKELRKNRQGRKAGGRTFALYERKQKLMQLRNNVQTSSGGRPSTFANRNSGFTGKKGGRVCFRCGEPDHEVKDCKKPPPGGAKMIEDEVSLVCMICKDAKLDQSQIDSTTSSDPSSNVPAAAIPDSTGSNLLGQVDKVRVQSMTEKSDTSSEASNSDSDSDSNSKSKPEGEKPPANPTPKAKAMPKAPNYDLQQKILLMERTNRERK